MDWIALGFSLIVGALPVFIINKFNRDVVCIESKKEKLYFGALPVVLVILCIYISITKVVELTTIDMCNRMTMFALLWGIAFVDLRTNIIPNEFIVAALLTRCFAFVIQLFTSGYPSVRGITAELFVCLIVFCLCFIVRFLSRSGLGMGDIKLMTIMPLFYGPIGGLRALLYALIVIFVQSVFCLLTKRKGKKDVLAFGPAIAIGAWISVLIAGY